MKKLFLFFLFAGIVTCAFAQNESKNISIADTTKKIEMVEMACGQCQFHLAGNGCDLAVRIKGKAYFVDGAGINDFGDAHAKDGFCEAISNVEAQGKIIKGRYKASYLKLIR